MDYIIERQDLMTLNNVFNIDASKHKGNYAFTEEDIKKHINFGITKASNFEQLNKSEKMSQKLLNINIIFKKYLK